MKAVIASEFSQRQPMYPIILLMIDILPQLLLDGLVLPFGLTISLRVVHGIELPFDAKVMAECCPKF